MQAPLLGSLAAAMIFLAVPGLADAQGKGKGSDDKAPAAGARGKGAKGNDAKGNDARVAAPQERGRQARADERGHGKSDANADRGRARAAEVREVGGAVAGPADMAKGSHSGKAERASFKSSMKGGKFFRAFDSDDSPDAWRGYAMSPKLTERYAGRVATLAFTRGVPENALVIRALNDRVMIVNPAGAVLLDLDELRARNLGAWRVVSLGDPDDGDKEGSPAFCRSGAGHPNWGRQWCVDKGFRLGAENDLRWGRAVSVEDVIFRPAAGTGDLTRDVLAAVLGDVVLNRLAAHAITLGLADPLAGRWVVEPAGRRVLLVNSGPTPVAEIVDTNRDDRADLMLVALKAW